MAKAPGETLACDKLWTNARLATMSPAVATPYGAIDDGLIAARDERIVYVGPRSEAPAFQAAETVDCEGRWITPGLIDCHTHLVYGGDRAHEFELRLQGATYEEIARAGGGILSTVKATREASEDTLFASADRRLAALMAEGVTTVEIKSGYGLEQQAELKQLRVARRIGRERPVTVRTTFLGAHAVPPEYKGRSGDYTALVAGPILDAVAAEELADAVDVFCEGIAFSPDETKVVFEAAKARASRSRSMPSSFPISTAPSSRPRWALSPPTISNISTRTASPPWPRPAPSRSCCLAPSTSCARRRNRRSS